MLCTLALLTPAFQVPPVIEKNRPPNDPVVARDVRYAKRDGVDAKFHSLDIYAPSTKGPHPVIVMVHGGGWRLGDKANPTMWKDKAPYFVGEGFVYISINYRLTNGEGVPQHPVHVADVAAALTWVHDHVAKHRGDPNRIFLMGHSSGAHLAALVATDARRLAKHGKTLRILKGVICLDTAGYDIAKYLGEDLAGRTARAIYTNAFGFDAENWKDASPKQFLDKKKGIPPMLIFHTKDRKEVAELSRAFVAGLRAINVPAAAVYANDKSHSGINECIGKKGDPYTALIMRFLAAPSTAS
ncbi:MAG: alpha/beta hydrolase, partial [Planctomycetes bacterium]|nr:alpha/beta hydrolase [Planctomycetota bacterium]